LTGTFGGALEARKIAAGDRRLVTEARGEVERDGKVLVIKRIHADYYLRIDPAQRETAQRVHEMHIDFCPVARTLKGCVQITTQLHMQDA
jgi:uncharacterized OsmC-like protein